MVEHNGVTLQMEVIPERLDELRDILQKIVDEGVEDNHLVPFRQIDTAHYARWVILGVGEFGKRRKRLPLQLFYSASVDGPVDGHLEQLVEHGQSALDKIYPCCKGYPQDRTLNGTETLNYLKQHKISSTFYTGIVGVSLGRVHKEADLYTRIQKFLDGTQKELQGLGPKEVREKIQFFVKSQPDLSWALKRDPFSFSTWMKIYGKLVRLVGILAFFVISGLIQLIGLLFALPAILHIITLVGTAGLGIMLIYVIGITLLMRIDELRSSAEGPTAPDDWILKMQERETLIVQNQWSAGENIRNRSIRRVYQKSFLWLVTQISPIVFIPTVHAARWLQINNNRELAFFTNFDGTSEGYFHTFIDQLDIAKGINMVFGSAKSFPITKWIRNRGAITNRSGYLRVIRSTQTITNVWYCAVKHLSVENIKNNKHVRRDLFGSLSVEKTEAWLRRF